MSRSTRFAVLLLSAAVVACGGSPGGEPTTEEQRTLYALGVRMAQFADEFDLTADELPWVQRGFADGTLGDSLLDPNDHQDQVNALLQTRLTRAAAEERRRSEAYVEARSREDDAVRGEEGWVRTILEEGDGPEVQPDDVVRVRFTGRLRTGEEVDSSDGKGPQDVTAINLATIIDCWKLGLTGVREGATVRLTCPPDLVHGDRGLPGLIPGGSAVSYEIEIRAVERFGLEVPQEDEGDDS